MPKAQNATPTTRLKCLLVILTHMSYFKH